MELIWWTVAPKMSKKELRKRLKGSLMAIAMPVASRTRQFQMLKAAVVNRRCAERACFKRDT